VRTALLAKVCSVFISKRSFSASVEEGRISTADTVSAAPVNTTLLADHFENEQDELAPFRGLVNAIKIAVVFWMMAAGAFYLFL
jgi:hypothetical protein